VRDAELGGQFAHLRFETAAGEELGRAVDDLLLAFARFQALSRRRSHCARRSLAGAWSAGFCCIDHLVNSAEIVERLVNKPHPEKP